MAPIIRAVLSALIGEEDAKDIEIVSNDVDIHEDGTWEIKYRHPTRYVVCTRFARTRALTAGCMQWVRS